jgi:hypothetical protein
MHVVAGMKYARILLFRFLTPNCFAIHMCEQRPFLAISIISQSHPTR